LPWTIERLPAFDKAIGELQKRFPHAEDDILGEFKLGPPKATNALPAYGRKLWKARAGSSDLNRGKSGGFRIIYYWDQELPNHCLLAKAYFKGDQEDLPPAEIVRLYASIKERIGGLRK
jgi:mRNA-degrading endonuclease RelE of RelBE toxin-antitoxin system